MCVCVCERSVCALHVRMFVCVSSAKASMCAQGTVALKT